MGVNAELAHLEFGDHVCCPVSNDEECHAAAAAGAAASLRCEQKVLYFVRNPDGLRYFLATRVPGAERAMARQQIQIYVNSRTYGPDQGFECDRVLDFMASEVELADRQGFAGLRSVGDLSAVACRPRDIDAVIEYETRLNAIFASGRIIGICHYNRSDFPAKTWRRILSAHPTTVLPTRNGSIARLRGTRTPRGMILTGGADLVNHGALASLLSEVVPLPGHCRIDATGLEFVDAQAIGCLLRTAEVRADRPTTINCGAHLAELLDMCGSASVPGLTVTVDTGSQD